MSTLLQRPEREFFTRMLSHYLNSSWKSVLSIVVFHSAAVTLKMTRPGLMTILSYEQVLFRNLFVGQAIKTLSQKKPR
jgi:hypothetical protein